MKIDGEERILRPLVGQPSFTFIFKMKRIFPMCGFPPASAGGRAAHEENRWDPRRLAALSTSRPFSTSSAARVSRQRLAEKQDGLVRGAD